MHRDWQFDHRSLMGLVLLVVGTLFLLGNFGFWGLGKVMAGLFGALVLGSISVVFWSVWLNRREHWWAIIPGGVLGTLALTSLLGTLLPFVSTGGLFFFGLAATFGLLYRVGEPKHQVSWAIIPALSLAAIGAIATLASIGRWLLPLGLVGLGIYLIRKNYRHN